MRTACRYAGQFEMEGLEYPTVSFFISCDDARCANANPHRRAKPFGADTLRAITPRTQTNNKINNKETRTEKLHAFSQKLLSFAALFNKLRTAQQTVCKTRNPRINKAHRHKPCHREMSVIIPPRIQNEFTTARSRSSAME